MSQINERIYPKNEHIFQPDNGVRTIINIRGMDILTNKNVGDLTCDELQILKNFAGINNSYSRLIR